jgi:hypothetical protein
LNGEIEKKNQLKKDTSQPELNRQTRNSGNEIKITS